MTKKHDVFTGRDSACTKSATPSIATIRDGREKAFAGRGEGFTETMKATEIAVIVSREVRFCLTFCVIVYCIVEGLL